MIQLQIQRKIKEKVGSRDKKKKKRTEQTMQRKKITYRVPRRTPAAGFGENEANSAGLFSARRFGETVSVSARWVRKRDRRDGSGDKQVRWRDGSSEITPATTGEMGPAQLNWQRERDSEREGFRPLGFIPNYILYIIFYIYIYIKGDSHLANGQKSWTASAWHYKFVYLYVWNC